jgi:translation initiation factor 1
MAKSNRLVYSTETGRTCPSCEQAIDNCTCSQDQTPEGDGIVRVSLDTKGRKGKGVTVLTGILLKTNELKGLAKSLKKKCGVGGAVKDGNIEIQGDHRDLLIKILTEQGYKVKRSGG